MSSSLRSRHKRLIAAIIVVLITLFLYAFQQNFSEYLNRSKSKINDYLSTACGYRIILSNLSFNYLRGFYIKEAAIFYQDEKKPFIFLRNAQITLKILPLFLGKVMLNEIKIERALCMINRKKEGYNLQIMFSDIYNRLTKNKGATGDLIADNFRATIGLAKIIYTDNPYLEKNMYVLLKAARLEQRLDKFRLSVDIGYYHRLATDTHISRLFKKKQIHQEIKCAIQGKISDKNLNMEMVVLKIGNEQILGMGVNRNFASKNPILDIKFIPSTISLENIGFLRDNFYSKGQVFISLTLNGLLDSVRTFVVALLTECNFRYESADGRIFDLRNFNAELEYKPDYFNLNNCFLEFNDVPLDIKLQVTRLAEPNINFNLSVPQEFFAQQKVSLMKLELIFNGKLKDYLLGNLDCNILYLRKAKPLEMQAKFKNLAFDYKNPKEKLLKAGKIELIKDNKNKIQKLNFSNLRSKLYFYKKTIDFTDLGFEGYNGILKGKMKVDFTDKATLTLVLNGIGLDVKTIMRDINITDKLLKGRMNVRIAFDNRLTEFLKGSCLIKKGVANLDDFAAIVKLPPLSNTDFDLMHAYFSFTRSAIKVKNVKLLSPQLGLNANWDTNGKIEGTMDLKVASALLNQSAPFKKLLRLTKIEKPFIDFSFLLGGVPEAVRVMWLKGEFKEKIMQDLPAWVGISIEDNIEKTIDELSKDKNSN